MEKAKLGNISCFTFNSRKQFLDYIRDKKLILVAVNAEKIVKDDNKLAEIINTNIGYADGIGAVKALKKKGYKDVIRIPGSEFWLDIVKEFSVEKTFYFIGSTDDVIEETVKKLKSEFNELKILNYHNGFLEEEDKELIINDIKAKKPDVIFVAQGTPRQEYLMAELIKHHKALYMGLGGSFDAYVGKVKRAPKFFQNLGLEWFYRLLQQPTRIKRQKSLVKFYYKMLMGKL
jgi:UDP-N-acetyl-D-mannosaminouronate:lipid I N-acetyl-D-mannosaminouronosyltransferase